MNTKNSTNSASSILTVLFLMFLVVMNLNGQTTEQRLKIASNNKNIELASFKSNLVSDYEMKRIQLKEVAKLNNWKIKETLANGKKIELQEIGEDGSPLYYETYSDEAGLISRASTLNTKDKIEVTEAAADGLLLSNHSYGIKADRVPDWYFGAYTKVAQDWDKIMYNAPYYLMVSAAGNAQKSRDNESPTYGTTTDGFDVLLGFTLAKNGITVAGVISKIDGNGNLKSADVSAYSSFGPVDDGRIKPDIAGNGGSVLSTDSYSNTSYNTSSGTSMATPGVTGSLLLLQQYNEELYGSYMKAATLKGLALNTAD